MPAPCYYHPDQNAVGNCVQCGIPICNDCTDRIGEKTVCHKCVTAVKTRLEAQMASAPAGAYGASPPSPGYSGGNYGTSQQSYGGPPPIGNSQAIGGSSHALSAEPLDTGRLILGIVAATLIGLVGTVVVEKVQFNLHFGLSLLYVFIGYGIGFGLHTLTKRGGVGMACLAVGIMVGCLVVSHLVLAADYLNLARASGNVPAGVTVADAFPIVIKDQNFMHWILILIGLYSCFKGMMTRA